MWRVHRTDSTHAPNSFNSTAIAPLVDALTINTRTTRIPRQGRFDPVHDDTICPGGASLGGYLYLGLSIGSVVAEGILRATDIPKTGVLSAAAFADLSLTRMQLAHPVNVAILDTQIGLAAINQDAALTGCSWRDYRSSRITCTKILVNTPAADGVRYRCRNGVDEHALMLTNRHAPTEPTIVDTGDLGTPGWARDLITSSLYDDFGITVDLP
ncbi:hypothetical protein GS489_01020 [Rhodococcus hoagii]|nr:hypothetical protein [Prescottella equi]